MQTVVAMFCIKKPALCKFAGQVFALQGKGTAPPLHVHLQAPATTTCCCMCGLSPSRTAASTLRSQQRRSPFVLSRCARGKGLERTMRIRCTLFRRCTYQCCLLRGLCVMDDIITSWLCGLCNLSPPCCPPSPTPWTVRQPVLGHNAWRGDGDGAALVAVAAAAGRRQGAGARVGTLA